MTKISKSTLAGATLVAIALAGCQPSEPVASTGTPDAVSSSSSSVFTSSAPAISYTMEDVATHATAEDCWTAVNGNVYELTPFVTKHPGGEKILQICGKDGTALFTGKHGEFQKAKDTIATLQIGTLEQ